MWIVSLRNLNGGGIYTIRDLKVNKYDYNTVLRYIYYGFLV